MKEKIYDNVMMKAFTVCGNLENTRTYYPCVCVHVMCLHCGRECMPQHVYEHMYMNIFHLNMSSGDGSYSSSLVQQVLWPS